MQAQSIPVTTVQPGVKVEFSEREAKDLWAELEECLYDTMKDRGIIYRNMELLRDALHGEIS